MPDVAIPDGTRLGRFTIVRRLGSGSIGKVYLGQDALRGHDVALKVVNVGPRADGELATRLQAERRAYDRVLDFRHVVRMYDIHSVPFGGAELLVLSMEYAEGADLRQWLRQHHDDSETRLSQGIEYFRQICRGVAACHHAGVVHLDIKPENVLLIDGVAKVADFGVAALLRDLSIGRPSTVGKSGATEGLGTVQYMSPEQLRRTRRKSIGSASDIYSLGVVLYELVDGELPFDGTAAQIRRKHLRTPPPRPEGPAAMWYRIISRCMAKEPEDRYPDVESLLRELDQVERHAVLGLDVCCPQCGHVNTSTDLRFCEKCRADLGALFRPCHICRNPNRIDVETCRVCGAGVLAQRIFLQRKADIERLKDEDPTEAIELLGAVLRDGAGDYRDRAVELIRKLTQKRTRISKLAARASEHAAKGELDSALGIWRNVLKSIPRHRVALAKIEELEGLRERVDRLQAEALDAIETARFSEADNLLQGCLSLAPAAVLVEQQLARCRECAQAYPAPMRRARDAYSSRKLAVADRELRAALAVAQRSPEALKLKSTVSKARKKAVRLLNSARALVQAADFGGAQDGLEQALACQADLIGIGQARTSLEETRKAYRQAMATANSTAENGDLAEAIKSANTARTLCPDSKEAESSCRAIDERMGRARGARTKVVAAWREGRFADAYKWAREAVGIWPSIPKLADYQKQLPSAETSYLSAMAAAERSAKEGDLAKALKAAERARIVCPDSKGACGYCTEIAERMDKARRVRAEVVSAWREGRFRDAHDRLAKAVALWPRMPEIIDDQERLPLAERAYSSAMNKAEAARNEEDFGSALSFIDDAETICSDSGAAQQLREETLKLRETREKVREERRRRAAERWKTAWRIACFPFAAVGIVLFFAFWAALTALILVGLIPPAYMMDVIISSFDGCQNVEFGICGAVWGLVEGMWSL